MDAAPPVTFLVFGDLHGRVLPAFRFASYWSRTNRRPLAGLLQVGDLGYFPDLSRMDRATIKHAKDDPLELGTLDLVTTNPLADKVFDEDPHSPPGLWFTAGNHEDFDELERLAGGSGRQPDFVVDAYCRVMGIKDGQVKEFPGEAAREGEAPDEPNVKTGSAGASPSRLRVGAIWGVDGDGRNCRKNLPPRGYVREDAVIHLSWEEFDVLLSHDGPADGKRVGYGSEALRALIGVAQPRFAFFGHYGGDGGRVAGDYGRTEVYHLAGFELRTRDGRPESGSVGVLQHTDAGWSFEFIEDDEMKGFTRHNWKWV
jgi:hypothetical protein